MSRHHSLAEAMSALLAYRTRPEGEVVPVQTNWSLIPANDNEPEVVGEMGYERIQLVTPSVGEIMRQVATRDIERNGAGQIVRIGRLKFSDGSQVELGYKCAPGGEVVAIKHRMPTGALLGSQDRQHTIIGGDDNPPERTASNNYFAAMFGVKPKKRIPAKKRYKRNGSAISREEAKAMLSEAYANTKILPEVKKYPPGLPSATDRISDNFIGMKKSAVGDSGGSGWQDISTALVDREIWAQAVADLSERDTLALDSVAHQRAKTYAEVGRALGQSRAYSDKKSGGRRALRRANDNLKKNLLHFR